MSKPKNHGSNVSYFMGMVEENDDSTAKDGHKLGRCRVRVLGIHSQEKTENDETGEGIPTDKLPWATPIVPPIYSSMNGIGVSPASKVTKGSWVLLMSMDGAAAQELFIMGSLAGVPEKKESSDSQGFNDPDKVYPLDDHLKEEDTNRLACNRNLDKTCVKEKNDSREKKIHKANYNPEQYEKDEYEQPKAYYETEYPKNLVFQSESGIVQEFDDTNGGRYHLYHPSGSFTEINPDGDQTVKIIGDDYQISVKDKKVYIKGACNVTIDGNANMLVKGSSLSQVHGNSQMLVEGNSESHVMGDADLEVNGDMFSKVEGDSTLNVNGDVDVTADGDVGVKGTNVSVGGSSNIAIKAPTISMNGVITLNDSVTLTGSHVGITGANVDVNGSNYVNISSPETGISGDKVDIDGNVKINGVVQEGE